MSQVMTHAAPRSSAGEPRELFAQLEKLAGTSLRGAFARRALRAIVGLVQIPESALEEAVAAPSDYETLIAALEADPGLLAREDPLTRARLDGLRARQELLAKEGGTLSAGQVAELLGISRQAVYKRQRGGRLLAIDCGRRGLAYPAWQFGPEGVLPGLEEVLAVLAEQDPWMQLAFFVTADSALGDETPLANLREGDLQAVLRAARLYGEHGAA